MSLFLGITVIFYFLLIIFLIFGSQHREYAGCSSNEMKTFFSIVIPFRDEEEHLPPLLDSLARLQYPEKLFEILLVDDFSKDTSKIICQKFQQENPQLSIRILDNEYLFSSPKKAAITTAVSAARGSFIITTDADCTLPEKWLRAFDAFLQKTASDLVAGPVRIASGHSILSIFQEIDMFSLQAATMGSFRMNMPLMCNGANLCYSKAAFFKVNGFKGNNHIASGDDLFLLQKFIGAGYKTSYLKCKEAIVSTAFQPDLPNLISQRIRWAAKASSYKSIAAKLAGVTVLLMNLMILVSLFFYLYHGISLTLPILAFFTKFSLDFILIYPSAKFFSRKKVMINYIWCSLFYPAFSSYVAITSLFRGYVWKGRRFSK